MAINLKQGPVRCKQPKGNCMKTETLDSIGTAGVKVSVVGAVGSGWGALSVNELAAIIGALVAIGGFVVTWYFKREARLLAEWEAIARNEREQAEHDLRMELMRTTGHPTAPPAASHVTTVADA